MGNLKTDIIKGEVRLNASPAQKELNQLAKNTAELTKQNERLRQEKTRLELADKRDAVAIRRLNKQIRQNNLTVKQNKFRMEELHKVVGLTSLSKTQLTKKSRSLQRQLDATSKSANPQEFRRLSKELRAVDKQLNKVRRGATATQRLLNTAKGFGAGMLGAFSVAQVASGIASFTKDVFNLSVKMEGDGRRANIVFGDSLGYVEKQAAKLSKKMGVTKNEFIAAASATADLLIPLDFTREQSAKMAVQLQSLTGALDEWTGGQVGASQISEILTKAMLGENEQLKQLGIAIRKDSEEFRTLVKEKMATTNATKAQAEAMATLELIQKKSADAQRAYVSEGSKMLRLLKSLKLWYRNVKESIAELWQVNQSTKLKNEQTEINGIARALKAYNGNQKKRLEYINQMEAVYPDFFKGLDKEKLTNEQIEKRLKGVNKQYRERIRLANIQSAIEEKTARISEIDAEQMQLEKQMSQSDLALVASATKGDVSYDALIEKAKENEEKNIEKAGAFIGTLARGGQKIMQMFEGENASSTKLYYWVKKAQERDALNFQLDDLLGDKSKVDMSLIPDDNKNEDDGSGTGGTGGSGKKPDVTPNIDKTAEKIEEWKSQAKELFAQAQQEIAAAKIAAMEEGYEKEKAKEEQRWQEEKAALEARIIQKAENQKELLPEQLAANAEIHKLIEEQEAAHLQKMRDLEATHKEGQQLKKTEADLLRLEEEMQKAEEEEVAFEEKLALAQERYDIEFAAAEGNRERELEARRRFTSAVDKIQEEQHRKEEMRKRATESLAQGLFNNMKAMAKKGTALSKALYLFEQAMAIRQVIVNTQLANAKAVAASPLTAGQPWVAINTTLGAASVGLILAQTAAEFKGKEEGGYLDVRREQDGKPFRARYKPNHRGYTSGPTVITGENGMEFVANAKAAQNPTVRPFLDIIDRAQRQGTIETLDLSAIRAEKYKGYASGGYLTPPSSSAFDEEDAAVIGKPQEEKWEEVVEVIKKMAERPIEFSLLRFNEAQAEKESIDDDINR